jgi:hypothetical protein
MTHWAEAEQFLLKKSARRLVVILAQQSWRAHLLLLLLLLLLHLLQLLLFCQRAARRFRYHQTCNDTSLKNLALGSTAYPAVELSSSLNTTAAACHVYC